jgi:NhaP-type Na+/H+ or K+/H+ antiporter
LNETERTFFAEIVFLIKTFFFVYIGLSIQLTNWWLVFTGLALTVVIFLLRIPVVRLAASKQLPQLDAALMAVIVPKGLAAAVLATLPAQQGVEKGELIQGIVYAVILFSIILTALMAFWLEKMQLPRPYRMVFASYAAVPEITEVRPGDSPPQQ